MHKRDGKRKQWTRRENRRRREMRENLKINEVDSERKRKEIGMENG